MNMRLVNREGGCALCGADGSEPCAAACPTQEWPRTLTPRLVATRALVGLVCFLALTAMAVPSYGWQLALALAALACALLYAVLRFAEQPTVAPARVTSRGRR